MQAVMILILASLLTAYSASAEIAQNMNAIVKQVVHSCGVQDGGAPQENLKNVYLKGNPDDMKKMQTVLASLVAFPKLKSQLHDISVTCVHKIESCGGVQAVGNVVFSGCKSGDSLKLRNGDGWSSMIHEIGHVLGKRSYYSSYNAASPPCAITDYSKKSRAEEFSEVFAAYMYAPRKLKQACPQAYDFMRDNVYGKDNIAGCEKGNTASGTAVAGSGGGGFGGGGGDGGGGGGGGGGGNYSGGYGGGSPMSPGMGINVQDLLALAMAGMAVSEQQKEQKELKDAAKDAQPQSVDASAGVREAPPLPNGGAVVPDSYNLDTPAPVSP